MSAIKLRVHTWPEPILTKKCRLVVKVDDNIRALLEEMKVLMRISGGIGLAANQAGLDKALVVCEVKGRAIKLVNPVITKTQGRVKFTEGCLSFPGIELEVRRFEKVWVEALDEHGRPMKIEADEIMAVVLQHEIDHINGIPFIFRIPAWKRLKIAAKLKAIKGKKK